MAAGADRDVTIDIIGRDNTSRATRSAARNFEKLSAAEKKSTKDTDKSSDSIDNYTKKVLGAIKPVAKLVATVAGFASLIGPAVTGTIGMAKGLVALAKAGASTASTLAPLVAFLPSLAGAAALLVGTVKLAGPGITKALSPIKAAFVSADGSTTRLVQHIQDLAGKGVEPLAKAFVKVNLPTIERGMDRIAVAVNGVVVGVGKWVDSAPGQQLIKSIVDGTATAAEKLAPKVTAVAVAVGNLAVKAGNKAITGFADVIGRILDKFTAWANSKSAADIQAALDKIRGATDSIRDGFDKLKGFGQWLDDNQGKIKAFSDSLAVIGLVVGVATGGWIGALVSGFSLIANHTDAARTAFEKIKAWLVSSGIADDLKQAFAFFKPAIIDAFKDSWNRLVKTVKDNEPQLRQLFAGLIGFLGLVVVGASTLVDVLSGVIIVVSDVVRAFDFMAVLAIAALKIIVDGAAAAFGWIPGIGPKLKEAATKFDAFANLASGALDRLNNKQVHAQIVVTLTGSGAKLIDNQGSVRIAGQGLNVAFAGGMNWAGRDFADRQYAGQDRDRSRTGGPQQVQVHNSNTTTVLLDGKPFRQMTARTVSEALERNAWRQKVGKR